MRLLWLPAVLRAAGLTVHEVSGWRDRGDDTYGPVRGITCHHTAGSRTATPQAEINVLLHGSNTAPPPIAQLSLDRQGEWYVVASGLCYHNLEGWAGPNEGYGNDNLLGIEAMHSGGTEPWTDVQYQSYVRGVAALVAHKAAGYDVTVARVAGHKEHQPGSKFDPTFNMDRFRADVRAALNGMEDDMFEARDRQKLEAVYALAFTGGPSCGTETSPPNGRPTSNSLVNKADALLARPAVTVDATAVAAALATNTEFIAAIAAAVADEQSRRLAS